MIDRDAGMLKLNLYVRACGRLKENVFTFFETNVMEVSLPSSCGFDRCCTQCLRGYGRVEEACLHILTGTSEEIPVRPCASDSEDPYFNLKTIRVRTEGIKKRKAAYGAPGSLCLSI